MASAERSLRYRSAVTHRVPLEPPSQLILAAGLKRPVILPAYQAELVCRCVEFKSLDDHARDRWNDWVSASPSQLSRMLAWSIGGHASPATRGKMLALLARLADEGLFVTSDLPSSLRREGTATDVGAIGFVTRNRPQTLLRSVQSYSRQQYRLNRNQPLIIVDDAGSEQEAQTRTALTTISRQRGTPTYYIPRSATEAYCRRLARVVGISSETLSFGLGGLDDMDCRTGANRNMLLLATAGMTLFSVDDDTVCCPALPSGANGGIRFDSDTEPRTFRFFRDMREALRSVRGADVDVLSEHGRFLGATPSACVRGCNDGSLEWADDINARFLEQVRMDRGRVMVTMNGLVGDSGIGWPTRLLKLQGRSREECTGTEMAYAIACGTRTVTRTTDKVTLSDTVFCMSTFVGLDNRFVLPPFMPIGRGQDTLFGRLLRQCYPDGLVIFLPTMLLHDPAEYRSQSREDVRRFYGYRMATIIGVIAASCHVDAPDGASRIKRIGRHLTDLASLSAREFGHAINLRLAEDFSQQLTHMQALVERYHGSPGYWADDVLAYVTAAREWLVAHKSFAPDDLGTPAHSDGARARFRDVVKMYGELLSSWPDIVQAARSLRPELWEMSRT